MRIKQASITAALLAVLWILGNPALAEASAPSTLASSLALKTADPFAAAPQLDLPSLTQQLRAMEERRVAASECLALCELATGIEAHPFGVASAESSNRSEDAWGNYRFTAELAPSHNRFGFTGHYWDKEASLYYAKARYYDPFTARFTQADSFLGTIDDPPSLHRYFYAADNPTFFVDPSGHAYTQEQLREIGGRFKQTTDAAGRMGGRAALVAGTVLTGGVLAEVGAVGIAGSTAIGAGGGFTVGYGNARIDGASHDEAVDAGNIGALQSSVAGAFGYLGGMAGSAWATAREWSGKTVGTMAAATGGFIGDLAAQGTLIAAGVQEKYDAGMGLFNAALGGVLGRRAAAVEEPREAFRTLQSSLRDDDALQAILISKAHSQAIAEEVARANAAGTSAHVRATAASRGVSFDAELRSRGRFSINNGDWRTAGIGEGSDGALYGLRDVDSGQLLKVGETSGGDAAFERFLKYERAARYTERNLALDVFDLDLNAIPRRVAEKRLRNYFESHGEALPWDNTDRRLGRPGDGIPGTRLKRTYRDAGYYWDGEELRKK